MSARNAHFATLCLLAIVLSACAEQPSSSTNSTPDAFGRELIAAWDSHDIDRILAFYTQDALYEDVPSVENGWDVPLRGQQMIRESLQKMFEEMPDLGLEFVSASGAGDRMLVEWVMTGTRWRDHTGNFSIRAVSVIRLEGDRVASVSDYYDAFRLLSQLGMVTTPGAGQPAGDGGDDDG